MIQVWPGTCFRGTLVLGKHFEGGFSSSFSHPSFFEGPWHRNPLPPPVCLSVDSVLKGRPSWAQIRSNFRHHAIPFIAAPFYRCPTPFYPNTLLLFYLFGHDITFPLSARHSLPYFSNAYRSSDKRMNRIQVWMAIFIQMEPQFTFQSMRSLEILEIQQGKLVA